MYKHLFSVLLILVMVFSMTACSNTKVTESENTEVFVPYENSASINEMTASELTAMIDEMILLSETKTLSATDMMNMGYNVSNIIYSSSNINEEKLNDKIISLFKNVYSQCIEQEIPFENISSWTSIPIAKVQLLYFSGNFTNVEDVDCIALYSLSENEATAVANAIFESSASFENSVNMVFEAIMSPYEDVQDLGIAVLTHISKHYMPVSDSVVADYCRILSSNSIATGALSLQKVEKTRNIIIANRNLDFVTKYSIFCNSNDSDVSSWAKEELLKVAKDCDKETSKQIKTLAKELDDRDFSSQLLKELKK